MQTKPTSFLLAVAVLSTACGGGDWVARAGPHELSVEEVAEVFAGWPDMPIRDDLLDMWAHRWVEWMLLADRMALGDSLLDSATAWVAFWPNIRPMLVAAHRERLLRAQGDMGQAVDSVFRAGELRAIQHILVRRPDVPARRPEAIRRIEAIHRRLVAGSSWTTENELNEDVLAKEQGGSIGIIIPGDTEPTFDSVAFALDPGALSGVVETDYGFHVIRRPPFAEVRDEFTEAAVEAIVDKADSLHVRTVVADANLRYADGAWTAMRDAATNPNAVIADRKVIGRYEGGVATVADVVKWLRAQPPDAQADMAKASDEQLRTILRTIMLNELLAQRALAAGIEVDSDQWRDILFFHRQRQQEVWDNLELDTYIEADAPRAERRAGAREAIRTHLREVAARRRVPQFVQTFVSDVLRDGAKWAVSGEGVQRAVARGLELRSQAGRGGQ